MLQHPFLGHGAVDEARVEAEEQRGHGARTDSAERRGAPAEIAAPEPGEARIFERLLALRGEVRDCMNRLNQRPQMTFGRVGHRRAHQAPTRRAANQKPVPARAVRDCRARPGNRNTGVCFRRI